MSTGDLSKAGENQHQITPPPSLPQEFNPSLLKTPLVQARAPDHRVPSQIRRAHRKPPQRGEPMASSAKLPPESANSSHSGHGSASNSVSSQLGLDAPEFDSSQSSGHSTKYSTSQLKYSTDLPLVPPLTDRRRSGSSSDWRWSLSTQYRSSQILELGQATPMDINLGTEPREVRIGRLRGSTSSSVNQPINYLGNHPSSRSRSNSQAVSDSSSPHLPLNSTTSTLLVNGSRSRHAPSIASSIVSEFANSDHRRSGTNSASSLPSAHNEYVTATEYTSSDSDEARRRARASASPPMDPNRALPLLPPSQPARYRRTGPERAVSNDGSNMPRTDYPNNPPNIGPPSIDPPTINKSVVANEEGTASVNNAESNRHSTYSHHHRSTIDSISKLEDLLNEANNLSFRSSSDLPSSADSPPKIYPLDPSTSQHVRQSRSFTATPPHLMDNRDRPDVRASRISGNESLNLLNPSPRPLLAPIDSISQKHRRRRHVSSPVEGSSEPIPASERRRRHFTQHSLENLMAQNPSPYDLKDIGLPAPERRLLERFIDSLSNLSVEVQMDEGKRKEGRRRLNNALRALEGWI